MGEGVIKKMPDGTEYVDEDDDRTLDKMIAVMNENDDTPDPDEEEILAEWLPKAFPDKPARKKKGRRISVPELEGELENQQFLKSDEERGLNLKK